MIGELRFRVEADSQQKLVALRDGLREDLEERGVTVIASSEAKASKTYRVVGTIRGTTFGGTVDAQTEQEAEELMTPKGGIVALVEPMSDE